MKIETFMKEIFSELDSAPLKGITYIHPNGKFVTLRIKAYTREQLQALLNDNHFTHSDFCNYENRNIFINTVINKEKTNGTASIHIGRITPTVEQYRAIALWIKQVGRIVKKVSLVIATNTRSKFTAKSSLDTLINDIKCHYSYRDYHNLLNSHFNGEVSFSCFGNKYEHPANRLIVKDGITTINFCNLRHFEYNQIVELCKCFNIPNRPIIQFEERKKIPVYTLASLEHNKTLYDHFSREEVATKTQKNCYSLEEYLKKELKHSWQLTLPLIDEELDIFYN